MSPRNYLLNLCTEPKSIGIWAEILSAVLLLVDGAHSGYNT